jgi:hypothetical protein
MQNQKNNDGRREEISAEPFSQNLPETGNELLLHAKLNARGIDESDGALDREGSDSNPSPMRGEADQGELDGWPFDPITEDEHKARMQHLRMAMRALKESERRLDLEDAKHDRLMVTIQVPAAQGTNSTAA